MNEVEKLRGLLTRCDEYLAEKGVIRDAKLRREIRAGLSQQAEPAAPFDMNEFARRAGRLMAEHDFHGFEPVALAIAEELLGAKAEPAPAQDDREFNTSDSDLTELLNIAADMLKGVGGGMDLGIYFAAVLERVEQRLADRPAQTEQQPVGYQFQDREGVWKQFMSQRHYEDTLADGTWPIRAIYAAPIAQTAPLRYTNDGALAECPCCGSLDVGGAHDTVHCYRCGLTVTKPRPLQNAMDAWNKRTSHKQTAPSTPGADKP